MQSSFFDNIKNITPEELKQENIQDTEEEPPGIISPLKNKVFHSTNLCKCINSKTLMFKKKFFSSITIKEWNNWQWQVKNRIRKIEQISLMLNLSLHETRALRLENAKLPVSITPYYMSLLSYDNFKHALRRTVIPTINELTKGQGEADDPLGEDKHSPAKGLVHRYPDRVLFLVSDFCSTYCRYCTRSRLVGHGSISPSKSRLQKAIEYIENTPSDRDVLISGGDPLTLSDEKLDWILKSIHQIKHVEIIRIGTKVATVLPQRITPQLTKILKKYHPLFMSLHFTHPEECSQESYRACEKLANAGIPLGSQTVLLKDINDNVETMKNLMHNLLKMRVRPYYIYQCDPISGSEHFRTSVEKGLEIIKGLRGFTSGYAVPTYVIDAPGGGGKIPLMPNYVIGKNQESLIMSNYEGKIYNYPDISKQ